MQVNQVTVTLVRRVVKKKGSILLPAQGMSMYPYIRQGDICHFEACDPAALKRGDVVLFTSGSNRLVAHRFIKKLHYKEKNSYLFKGDTNLLFDEPVKADQIIGRMTVIERKNKIVNLGTMRSNLWSMIIMNLPMMSKLLRMFIYRKEDFQY